MTIVLKDTLLANQTLDQGAPDFKGRALLGYGHGLVAARRGPASWGFQAEADQIWQGVGFAITAPGSLETGGSVVRNGTDFYGDIIDGTSVPSSLELDLFGCGELGLVGHFADNSPLGVFVMGGVTLQTKVGYGNFTAGSQSITGVGFQPDLVLVGGAGRTSLGGPSSSPNPFGFSYGAADGAGNQFACAVASTYLTNASARTSRTVNDGCFLELKPSLTKASLTSMDADGFTLNCSTFGRGALYWWAAIKDPGGQFAVGTGVEGDASFAPGFTPEAAMFASSGNTVFGTSQGGCGMALGGADALGTEGAGWESAVSGNVFSKNYWTSTRAMALVIHPSGVVSSSTAEANVTSWGSSCSLNWPVVSGNGIKFGWVAMKTSLGPGFDGCGGFIPQIYRWLKR